LRGFAGKGLSPVLFYTTYAAEEPGLSAQVGFIEMRFFRMLFLASFPLGRIRGIPIRIHWSAPLGLFILVFMSWLEPSGRTFTVTLLRRLLELFVIAAIPATVLTHELAHAMVAGIWGIRTDGIYLHILGGLALARDTAARALTHPKKMAILLAGPASNLICCAIALGLAHFSDHLSGIRLLHKLLELIAVINLAMGFFNLLPIWPLDGGQILNFFLKWIRLGSPWSDWITLLVSLTVGIPLAYFAWDAGWYFNFIVLSLLQIVAVALLAVYRKEPEEVSSESAAEDGPAPSADRAAQGLDPMMNPTNLPVNSCD
jgi:Zn-dependent protease